MSQNFDHPAPDPSYRRMVNAVKESESEGNPPPPEELYFDPDSGQLVVSRGAPTTRKGAVAAGTLARDGFFGGVL